MDKVQPESSLDTRQFQLGELLYKEYSTLEQIMDEPAIEWSKTFVILKVWRDGRWNLDSFSEMIDGLCKALSKLDRADLVDFVQHGEFIDCAVN